MIANKKKNPVKFDAARHYHPGSTTLKGSSFKVLLERSSEGIVKETSSVDVPAVLDQDGDVFLSRIKGNPDLFEWCIL